MATVRGALAQLSPAAVTLTDLYVVPTVKNATGRVIITNRSANAIEFRISIAVNGVGDSVEQYIAYDKEIAGKETGSTVAFMLGSTDVVRVYASVGDLSFTFTGIEQDDT